MALSEHIEALMREAGKPVTTRDIVDGLTHKTSVSTVSAWLTVALRRGIVRRVDATRPYAYELASEYGSGVAVLRPSRRRSAGAEEKPEAAPAYPPAHVHDMQRRINRSQLHMHLAIQAAISANLDYIVERVTKDALRRYVELSQRKEGEA